MSNEDDDLWYDFLGGGFFSLLCVSHMHFNFLQLKQHLQSSMEWFVRPQTLHGEKVGFSVV